MLHPFKRVKHRSPSAHATAEMLQYPKERLSWPAPPPQSDPSRFFPMPQLSYDSVLQEIANGSVKVKQQLGGTDSCVAAFAGFPVAGTEASLSSVMMGKKEEKHEDLALVKNTQSLVSTDNVKKRKAECVEGEECKDKSMTRDGEEEESKFTERCSGDMSADVSKANSKGAEVHKPDYIHVRARRGQATDSHSLAERARREKISKKMKCLQDLVPGCNKVMGKAGMLDEIINYVQSLQRQVEFLSMKLAALNPRLDFNIDDFLSREVRVQLRGPFCLQLASNAKFSAPSFSQLTPPQQGSTGCELGMSALMNPSPTPPHKISSSSAPFPELYLDSSVFSQDLPLSTWTTDLQRIYDMGFH